jgi:hypothetical protein
MMREEGLYQKVGDVIPDFFGAKNVTVRGILKPTGTLVDSYHFLSEGAFMEIENTARMQVVAEDNGSIKLFYYTTNAIPEKLKNSINSTSAAAVGTTTYYPVYIGAAEAQMMKEKKLFDKDGDTITNFFGNDVIVYSLPETKTVLDDMHFVDNSFRITD